MPPCRSAHEDIDKKYMTNVVVYSDGRCSWVPLGLYISACPINIQWFPFDDQFCKMKFGSWTYDGNQINLLEITGANKTSVDLSTYQDNGEWSLLGRCSLQAPSRHTLRLMINVD